MAEQSMDRPKVGWIGLGKMGTPMAANVQAAGYPLTVFNRTVAKAGDLIAKGARATSSIAELAGGCDIVVSMISDDAALLDVALGHGGALENATKGSVFIDMSTVSPAASQTVAELAAARGIDYLRAPVSGSTTTAKAAALTVLVSGPEKSFERCRPLFQAIGSKLYYVGGDDQARYLKIIINMMIGTISAMVAEALTLGEKGGVDWRKMIEVIDASVASSPLFGYKKDMLANRNFAPMFTAIQMAKDLDLALDAGRVNNAPLPLAALSRQLLASLIAKGHGEDDFFSFVTLLEDLAGLHSTSKDPRG